MVDYICTSCLYEGPAKKRKPGSAKLDKLLWYFFPFGLPYFIWRILAASKTCRYCGKETLTPLKGFVGQKIKYQLLEDIAGKVPADIKTVELTPPPAKGTSTVEKPISPPPRNNIPQDPDAW